jgi:integrase
VMTREEVARVLEQLPGVCWIVATLLYGAGLRLLEALRLRVKDVDFARCEILVRDGKGQKDRVTMLPRRVIEPLQAHLLKVQALHQRDLAEGFGRTNLPFALARKYPNAAAEWGWQFVFPSINRSKDPRSDGNPACRADQARHAAYLPPFLCDSSAGKRPGHPHRAGVARPCRCEDHADLYPCAQSRWIGCAEPARPGMKKPRIGGAFSFQGSA